MHLISSVGEQGEEKKESWTLETHLESLVQFQFQVIICSNNQIILKYLSNYSQFFPKISQLLIKSNNSQTFLKKFSSTVWSV